MSITLTDRVHAILAADDQLDRLFGVALAPLDLEGTVPQRDSDQAEWSVAVGAAYAIARGEDAYESTESVIERAQVAARGAWERRYGVAPFTGEAA